MGADRNVPIAHHSKGKDEAAVNIAVLGLGYVGAVTAACLAKLSHTVIGVDTDATKATALAKGISPVEEPGLDELLAEGVAAGRVRVATIAEAVQAAEIVMICVGTPSTPSGALDLAAVSRVADEVAAALPHDGGFRTIVVRSTVLPGTTEEELQPRIEARSGMRAGHDFGLAMNPEFLREGSSIDDFFRASRTIIGAIDDRTAHQVAAAYAGVEASIEVVPIRTAEMVKYTDNAFHALKIAFANEIASFARAWRVDGREVMRLLTLDDRQNISPAYLRPGYAFGGSCLPKDLRALVDRARKSDLDLPLLNAAMPSNLAHFERGVRLVEAAGGRRVAILGLSFKPATDDLRESPAVALAERLIGRGYQITIYDPDVDPQRLRGANRAHMEQHLPHLVDLLCASLDDAIDGADTVVVTKAWAGVQGLGSSLGERQVIVDLVGIEDLASRGPERYCGIGW